MVELEAERIPKLYETEKIPLEEKVIYEKYFKAHLSWFIAERKGDLCFGYFQNLATPHFSEWGYFSMSELKEYNVEKDKWFEPIKFKDLMNSENIISI